MDQEFGRPHYIMDKVWQMMQSNDTKTMNLDKDFEELMGKAQQTGWNGSTTRFWTEKEEDGRGVGAARSLCTHIYPRERVAVQGNS